VLVLDSLELFEDLGFPPDFSETCWPSVSKVTFSCLSLPIVSHRRDLDCGCRCGDHVSRDPNLSPYFFQAFPPTFSSPASVSLSVAAVERVPAHCVWESPSLTSFFLY